MKTLCLALWAQLVCAQTLPLSPRDWDRQLTLPPGVAAAQAAQFSETGDQIGIGPWLAGTLTARLESLLPLPTKEGSVHGKFRTEQLYPHQATVRITFKQGNRRVLALNYALGVAERWENFTVPIARTPAGADSVWISFGLSERTSGKVHFSDLRVSDSHAEPAFPARPSPVTRAKPPASLQPGPAVRLEKILDTWWLVDTGGKAFFSSGSVTPKDVFAQVQKLGFNSVASSHDVRWWAAFNDRQVAAQGPVIFQFRTVGTNVGDAYETLVDATGANPGTSQAQSAKGGGFNHAFPDPFDPRWEASLQKRVHESRCSTRASRTSRGGWRIMSELIKTCSATSGRGTASRSFARCWGGSMNRSTL